MAATQETDPGLERLIPIETIKVKQLTSSYAGNNFTVFSGEDVLLNLVEESHDFSVFSFGHRRGFHMDGLDNTGKKVFSLRRPGSSLSDKIELRMHDALVAIVRLKATLLTPVFRIYDAQKNLVLRLKGKITDYDNFVLQTKVKKTIGSISRKVHETFAQSRARLDEYTISFPADLDVNLKVAVIVACVLIDFRLHEVIVPSLERLSSLESILINQRVSDRKGNHYAVLSGENTLFDVIEEPQELGVFSGGNRRGFHMDGVDNMGKKVFSFRRPSMKLSDKIELSMNDAMVSVVRMKATSLTPCFSINDAQDCPVYSVKGKLCTNASSYQLETRTKSTIGSIQKKDRGWRNEMLSRNDDYVISFPADLAVHFKLAVMGACVLIDFRFHEYRRR